MAVWLVDVIEVIFSCGLFINAMLFIPQAIKLFKTKDSRELSLLTFAGFNVIQAFVILHGIVEKDPLLIIGYTFSFMTCGSVTVLTLRYRLKRR
ncbi:MAG: hypothetical protein JXR42_01360 [Gammaproteobacteria bacterium]|nr:hypothetical protein [Gammaproteobacteria bacterium]